jgi:4a-hydroxytetrahydrobiopterin dehydratase
MRLTEQSCRPYPADSPPLASGAVAELLPQVPGWAQNDTGSEIARTFKFSDYYETLAFVNALAWIAHREDHHPDLEVGYNRCRVRFSTHTVKGLSLNDFICAAKVNALLPAG